MNIDWMVVATIAAPLATLVAGVFINRWFENRPVLISYYQHVSSFRHVVAGAQPLHVHTHSVVLRNTGRVSATNVRLRHATLPSFQVWPDVAHRVEDLPGGGREIVIPTLVPGEQITVSYLYAPPLVYDQVNKGIRCDQGFAQEIPVLLLRQYPRWVNRIAGWLMILGMVTVAYGVYEFAAWAYRHLA
jgi:hypothetical protein